MKNCILFILFSLCSIKAFSQKYLADNEYHYGLINGMELLIIQDPSDEELTLNLTFKTGPFIEDSMMNGMSYFYEKLFVLGLQSQLYQNIEELTLDLSQIEVSSQNSYERTSYEITFPGKYLTPVLKSIKNNLAQPKLNPEKYERVRATIIQKYDSLLSDPDYLVRQRTGKLLWRDYYQRRTFISNVDSLSDSTIHKNIEFIWANYYCAGNALLSIKGNITVRSTLEEIKRNFNDWERCSVNPFIRYPVPEYKRLRFSAQLVDEHTSNKSPYFRISFQGPNTSIYRSSIYPAIILSSLLSDPYFETYKFFTDSSSIQSMEMEYLIVKYASQLSITLIPDSAHIYLAYKHFWENMKQCSENESILAKDFQSAKERAIESFRYTKANSSQYLNLISKFWASARLDDYGTFEDSILAVKPEDFKKFIDKFILQNTYISSLSINPELRDSSKIDTAFTDTKKNIEEYVFQFKTNTAEFEDNSYDSLLVSLAQFLKINPDIMIKVNGVTNKDELQSIYDKEMFQYFKSMKHFVYYPRPKRNIRLDVYRSMVIIKKLIEAGIEPTRLFGTGRLDRTGDEKNVHCTLLSKE